MQSVVRAEHEWLFWAYKHQHAAIIPDQPFEHCREWLSERQLELGYAVPLTAADRRNVSRADRTKPVFPPTKSASYRQWQDASPSLPSICSCGTIPPPDVRTQHCVTR